MEGKEKRREGKGKEKGREGKEKGREGEREGKGRGKRGITRSSTISAKAIGRKFAKFKNEVRRREGGGGRDVGRRGSGVGKM